MKNDNNQKGYERFYCAIRYDEFQDLPARRLLSFPLVSCFVGARLFFLLSSISASTGNKREPKGRQKITSAGIQKERCHKCARNNFFSSFVHVYWVFLCFMRSFMKPLILSTSKSSNALFLATVLESICLIIFSMNEA